MAKRLTKEKIYITLPEETIKKIESMAATWTYDTKAFVRSRLNQYKPSHRLVIFIKEAFFLLLFMKRKKRQMNVLNNPEILRDWKKRFLYSGETNQIGRAHV